MRILLVEDDDDVRQGLRDILFHHGHDVHLAADGRGALALADAVDPDLVLTDLLMPEMDGLETIIALRRKRTRARIVAMTGGDWPCAEPCMQSALRFGANALLVKPFSAVDLLSALGP